MQLHSTYYPHHRHLLSFLSLLLSLALTFVACSGPGSSNNSTATATTSTGNGSNSTATVSTSPTAQVHLGPQPCPNAVKDPAHWDAIVGTQNGVSKVGRVTCANLVGQSSLQTLILVGYQGTGLIVDIYVYDHITDPHPTQLFKLQGLYKGDARISGYNTVLTAEVDSDSSINKDKSNAALTLDLFREFKWSDGADTFVPVAFPGIFPDLTRYQAEVAQAAANQGHEPWRLSATMTAQALAANSKLLKWSNTSATIISGGGDHDINAVISLKNSHPAGGSIIVTLNRLEQNSNGGIWEATSVTSNSMSITTPHDRDRLTSPTTVMGTGSAFEGIIGKVIVLDHLYTDIGHTTAKGATGNGPTSFSTKITYTSSFKNGTQEGLVVLYSYSNADSSIVGAVIVKEMLS